MNENIDPKNINQPENTNSTEEKTTDNSQSIPIKISVDNASKWKPNFNFVFYYLLPIVTFLILLVQFFLDSPTVSSYFYSPEIIVETILDTAEWHSGHREIIIKNTGNRTAEEITINTYLGTKDYCDSVFIQGVHLDVKELDNYKIERIFAKEEVQLFFICDSKKLKNNVISLPNNEIFFSIDPNIRVRHKNGYARYFHVFKEGGIEVISDSLGNPLNIILPKTKRIEINNDDEEEE